ncbi:MAG TPA: ABC transporter ATP-binding protein [Oscillospiraceae bacterium]|nr:ABC transporter ATP-binding protein [Oscillospiraceae bacterium]
MIKKLAPYMKGYEKEAALAPVTVIFEVLIEILIPFLMAKIVDVGIANRDVAYVAKLGGIMVGMALFSMTCGALSGKFAATASTGFACNLRKALFNKIQDFSFANTDRFSTASLVTRMTADVTNVQNAAMDMVRVMFRAPVMLVSALIITILMNAELSSVFLIVIPAVGLLLAFFMAKAHPLFTKMLKKYDAMNASVQEDLIGIRVIKAFVRKDFENEKFTASADDLRAAQRKAENLIVFAMPLMTLSMYACILSIFWFGGHAVIEGTMLTGELISFITYVGQILMSLVMIAMIFVNLVLSKASAKRIIEVLDEKIDITDDEADPALKPEDGSVVFDHVDFSYAKDPKNLTLTDVSLSICSGETIGILGGTGSAKTTFVQLIPRLYDVGGGRVLVGGRDVRDYKLKNLRAAVAMVLQKNVLFSGTIRDNLKWGNPDASDEEMFEAAKAAQAHDFILSFPNGYDTDLGQGGVNVSGGQKQRLCIARALLARPKILILDDSTSAVDTATDAKIRAAFREKRADMTVLIIAQRIASVMDADRILVLDNGRISDCGTHEELLVRSPIYREVYESQQKGDD